MLKGLKELEEKLKCYNIPFFLLSGKQVYDKIRYMNRNGAKNKFDIDAYIKKYSE